MIPIFFSVNDAYAPYLAVAVNSIRDNASPAYSYRIHILSDDLSAANKERLGAFAREGFEIVFVPLSEKMASLCGKHRPGTHRFHAFSSLTIYFRLFIPALFPEYDKAIYLDSDIVVPGDISRLWNEKLGGKLIGACADYSIQHIAPFMRYIDSYVGVDHRNYVNSGVLLLDMRRLREVDLAGQFLRWMRKYAFETVAPDQDYLNALCWNAIHYLDPVWDAMPSDHIRSLDNPQIIHFNLDSKPWLNESVPYDELFWHYAATSGYEADIRARRTAFLQRPSAVRAYRKAIEDLVGMAAELSQAPVSFRSVVEQGRELRLCS